MSERGYLFEEDSIDHALFRRHVAQKLRRSGRYTKGPKKLVKEDRERFVKELQKSCRKLKDLRTKQRIMYDGVLEHGQSYTRRN